MEEQQNQNIDWLKDLVRSEEQMEKAGLVDFSPVVSVENIILSASISFLKDLKQKLIENANIFNQLKGSAHGGIKVYGIAKTHADFMLFRNGYKLIFNLTQPGKIKVSFHHMSTPFVNSQQVQDIDSPIQDSIIEAAWGAFNEVRWINDGKPVNMDHLVKYSIRNFVQSSTK